MSMHTEQALPSEIRIEDCFEDASSMSMDSAVKRSCCMVIYDLLRGSANRLQTSILRDHLASNGATVLTNPKDLEGCDPVELDQGFIVVPHDVPHAKIPATPSFAERLFTATEWWVETCLTRKTLIDPAHHLVDMADDVLCRPFTRLGIEGNETSVKFLDCLLTQEQASRAW